MTGKGGVGRTTVAAAMALAAARHGKRTLLLEIGDPEGGYSAVGRKFGREHLTPDPERSGVERLSLAHLWATRGHELFARTVIPSGPLVRAALASKPLQKFLIAAPSFYEMGVFFHLLTLLEDELRPGVPRHEVVVLDMPATGHTLALTSLPELLLEILPGGPIPRYMRRGQAFLNDPAKGVAWVVTLPEQLPVTEALELVEGLRETKVTPAGVIMNRIPSDPFTPEERTALEAVLARQPMHGEMAFHRIGRSRAAEDRLAKEADLPVVELPLTGAGGATEAHVALSELLYARMEAA